jgi:hypothetical protein
MQRFLIQCINCVLLMIILIGVPAVTRAQWGSWWIASAPKAQMLTLWALALVAIGNAAAAMIFIKGRKQRKLCGEWAAVFGALLFAYCAFVRGYFNFDWLKQALLWLQKRF